MKLYSIKSERFEGVYWKSDEKSPFLYISVFWVWRNLGFDAVIRQRMTAFHGGLSDMVQSLGSRYYVFYLMWAIRGKFYMSWVRCIAFSNKAFLLGNKNSTKYLGHTCKTSIHYYLLISNGELSDPLSDSVNRGLTLVKLYRYLC